MVVSHTPISYIVLFIVCSSNLLYIFLFLIANLLSHMALFTLDFMFTLPYTRVYLLVYWYHVGPFLRKFGLVIEGVHQHLFWIVIYGHTKVKSLNWAFQTWLETHEFTYYVFDMDLTSSSQNTQEQHHLHQFVILLFEIVQITLMFYFELVHCILHLLIGFFLLASNKGL